MATPKSKKAQVMDQVRSILKTSRNVVLAEYRGLNVEQVTAMRAGLRKAGVKVKVLKNTLSRKLFKEAGMDNLDSYLKGPMAVSFLSNDVGASAKALVNYAKANELFVIKGGYVEGKAIALDGVKAIASLPSREVLLAQLLGTLQAPVRGLMTVLQGNTQKLVYALNALKDQKQKAAA